MLIHNKEAGRWRECPWAMVRRVWGRYAVPPTPVEWAYPQRRKKKGAGRRMWATWRCRTLNCATTRPKILNVQYFVLFRTLWLVLTRFLRIENKYQCLMIYCFLASPLALWCRLISMMGLVSISKNFTKKASAVFTTEHDRILKDNTIKRNRI